MAPFLFLLHLVSKTKRMSKVLITGGAGLLGSNTIRVLLERKYDVVALVEDGLTTFTIDKLPIQIITGDILDPNSYESIMSECDFVIHAAASTSVWPTRSETVNKINITGTQNICNSVKKLGLKKIVHVGTANTFGFGNSKNPGNEETAFNSKRYGLDYIDSKYKVHHWILDKIKSDNLPATIVNPTFMLGPYDSKPSSGEMVRNFYLGKIPGYTPGGRNFIYVKDAAIGVVNALEKGGIGESYILGHRNMNYKEFFALMSETLNCKAPKLSLPKWVFMIVAHLNVMFAKIGGFAPRTFPSLVHIAYDEQYFSPSKAVNEIDLPQTPIEQAVKECYTWLKENNYL